MSKETFPKYLVIGNDIVIGRVTYHKDLLWNHDGDIRKQEELNSIKGGGKWDMITNDGKKILRLYGESHDFGAATYETINNCLNSNGKIYSHRVGMRELLIDKVIFGISEDAQVWSLPITNDDMISIADVRNKLGPVANLVAMLKNEDIMYSFDPKVHKLIESEIEQVDKSIEYFRNYPNTNS